MNAPPDPLLALAEMLAEFAVEDYLRELEEPQGDEAEGSAP